MNSKLTCKTCVKENVPDWNGKGQCITCSRDEVLGVNSKLRAILQDIHNALCDDCQQITEAEKAIRQAVGEEMLELVDSCFEDNNGYIDDKLRQKIKAWQGGEDE